MNRPLVAMAGLALGLSFGALGLGFIAGRASAPAPEVFFAPGAACTDHAVELIDRAEHDIAVDAYGFSSARVIDALIAAQKRGVRVDAVLDRSDDNARPVAGREPGARLLAKAGASVRFDSREPIHHTKAIVADGEVVFAGSWNLTKQAERNAEDCNVWRSAGFARKYLAEHEKHRAHSEPGGN